MMYSIHHACAPFKRHERDYQTKAADLKTRGPRYALFGGGETRGNHSVGAQLVGASKGDLVSFMKVPKNLN